MGSRVSRKKESNALVQVQHVAMLRTCSAMFSSVRRRMCPSRRRRSGEDGNGPFWTASGLHGGGQEEALSVNVPMQLGPIWSSP
jgi:hypothetical protein